MPRLRRATEADLPGIFAIYDREIREGIATCDTEPRTLEERLEWLAAHDPESYPALVIEGTPEDGDAPGVLAWGCLSPWSPRRAYARTCEDTLYVRADQQGRGLGRLMLGELIVRARATSRALVMARIVEGNPASRALHEALGFETIGVMPGAAEKFGRVLDVRLLGLRLTR